jgi:hypothetical protein
MDWKSVGEKIVRDDLNSHHDFQMQLPLRTDLGEFGSAVGRPHRLRYKSVERQFDVKREIGYLCVSD